MYILIIIHWALLEIYKNPLIYYQIESFSTHLYIYIVRLRKREIDWQTDIEQSWEIIKEGTVLVGL